MARNDEDAGVRAREVIVITRRGVPGRILCPACTEPGGMILPDEAAALCGVGQRTVFRWLEEGAIHFGETSEGSVFICLRSLLARSGRDDLLTNTKGESS